MYIYICITPSGFLNFVIEEHLFINGSIIPV